MKRARYRAAEEKFDRERAYAPSRPSARQGESTTKYDGPSTVAFRLGVDPRKSDQMVPRHRQPAARHRQDARVLGLRHG
jgi:large subunit ribosomal protein L1